MSESDTEEEESSKAFSHIESAAGSPDASVAAKAPTRKETNCKEEAIGQATWQAQTQEQEGKVEERAEKEAATKERKKAAAAAAIGSILDSIHLYVPLLFRTDLVRRESSLFLLGNKGAINKKGKRSKIVLSFGLPQYPKPACQNQRLQSEIASRTTVGLPLEPL
jgi:hypothetical protein